MASLYLSYSLLRHKMHLLRLLHSLAPAEPGETQAPLIGGFLSALETEIRLRADDARFHEPVETISSEAEHPPSFARLK